jgi:tetratricopeptide (TPR) repeat protein
MFKNIPILPNMNNEKKHNQSQSAKAHLGIWSVFLLLFFSSFAFAQEEIEYDYAQEEEINYVQEETNLLQQANELYAQGEYLQAANLYERILQEQGVAPELFYNLGNAYFKAHDIARAILNYERALRLNPRFADARYNLELAELRVLDNITPAETFFLKRWIDKLVSNYTSNQWFYFSWAMFILGLVGALLFVFGRSRALRKSAFTVAIVVFAVSALTLTFAVVRKNQFQNQNDAIVMIGVISVKSAPDRSGTDLFELREGTKVHIRTTLGDWVEIMIGDGRIGWVERRQIEQI